jgi:hypothetical protein
MGRNVQTSYIAAARAHKFTAVTLRGLRVRLFEHPLIVLFIACSFSAIG